MSLKFEIETWAAALQAYEAEDWDASLGLFEKIADNSKILTNMGLIYASLGEHESAIENFNAATALDNYLAIAYFQSGVSNFLLGQFDAALQEFEDAFQFLRGNESINYEQIGLKYQLYAAAVLFNQGITLLNLGDDERGMRLLQEAAKNAATSDHEVIDDAIQDRGEGYSVFSIPVGVLYRPNEKKVANMGAKDYMGKARLISTTAEAARTDFTPPTRTRTQVRRAVESTRDRAVATNLARSRSAVETTRPSLDDPTGPPKATLIGRSASASAASAAEPTVTPSVQPLAVSRSKSLRNLKENPLPPPETALPARPATRPTLKLNSNVERPPSPPSSDTPVQRAPFSRYGETGLTDIYDNYLEASDEGDTLPKRDVQKLGRKPSTSVRPPMPARVASLAVNDLRRKSSRSSAKGSYVGEERLGSFDFEMSRIRVKLFFKDEARGMVVPSDINFSEFVENVCAKFNYEFGALRLKFEDEDGTRVSLRDEGDWDMAVETARDSGSVSGSTTGKPGEGKLMIWCEEDYE